jgi:hypothetical protein
MKRRQFLAASVAASAFAMTESKTAQAQAAGAGREFYLLQRYGLQQGSQSKLIESYFSDALIPALQRMGMGPIGAFRLDIGPETPAYYLLIPGTPLEGLATLDLRLAEDVAFQSAAAPFWNATAAAPAFLRIESSLMSAFTGWPKLTLPPGAAAKAKRIFQLRTYENPSHGEHVRKVEMFNSGEFDIFVKAGLHPVFFGDTLVGSRMPNLTYMLSMTDLTELDAKWDLFRNDPNWKKLSTSQRYAYDQIVTNVTNLILSPLGCSQI